jgi:hypothetical protein
MKKKKPNFDLDEIKELLKKEDSRIVMERDRLEAVRLGYADDDEMVARVLKLSKAEFHKPMPSNRFSNLSQDAYYTYDGSVKLYIKLQISFNKKGVIISFKET